MQQRRYSWRNVRHVRFSVQMAVLNAPAHKYQRDVVIIGVPGAVGGAGWAAVAGAMAGEPCGLQNNLYSAAVLRAIAVYDACAQLFRDAGGLRLLHIHCKSDAGLFLQVKSMQSFLMASSSSLLHISYRCS